MKDLNELLKIKAEKQLREEITKWLLSVTRHGFFPAIEGVQVVAPGFDKPMSLTDYLWHSYSKRGADKIFDHFKNDYIQVTTQAFMDKVETMQNEINELRDQIPQ